MNNRTITTAEELDELPVGSVVLDARGNAWQRIEPDPDEPQYVWESGLMVMTAPGLPGTVVYRPDRDLIAEAKAEALREAAEYAPAMQYVGSDYPVQAVPKAHLLDLANRFENGADQ